LQKHSVPFHEGELRPFQIEALEALRVHRGHLAVDAPPGRGKTLVATAAALAAANGGVLWLEPLRELVLEKVRELKTALTRAGHDPKNILVDSGLGGEAPPDTLLCGQGVTVATFEYGFYNPPSTPLSLLIVDEAQELSDPVRGPLVAKVVLAALSAPRPPRVILLGHRLDPGWACLVPGAQVIHDGEAPSTRVIWRPGEQGDEAVLNLLSEIFSRDLHERIALFVGTVAAARRLATLVDANLDIPDHTGVKARAFHAGLPPREKQELLESLRAASLPVVVTTTALAKGLDLPLTTVIIRDLHLPGRPPMDTREVAPLAGRCGRRGKAGTAYVLRAESKTGSVRRQSEDELLALLGHGLLGTPRSYRTLAEEVSARLKRGQFARFFELVEMGIRRGTLLREGERIVRSEAGGVLWESRLPALDVMAWAGLFQEVDPAGFTPYDLMLLYVALFPLARCGRAVTSPGVPSMLWDQWLSQGRWKELFISLSGRRKTPDRRGQERLMGAALELMERSERNEQLPGGYATLQKLVTTGRSKEGVYGAQM